MHCLDGNDDLKSPGFVIAHTTCFFGFGIKDKLSYIKKCLELKLHPFFSFLFFFLNLEEVLKH